jgi:hypothetical protein
MNYAMWPVEIFLDGICNFVGMTEKTCEMGIIYSFRLIVMMNKMRVCNTAVQRQGT